MDANCKTTLNYCGFSGFWLNQTLSCFIESFKQSVTLRLKDQFIQKWHESISQGRKCTKCRIIITKIGFENYLKDLPDLLRKYFIKFRCRNNHLPIEAAGVGSQVLRDMRVCQFSKTDIRDEFHYLLCCINLKINVKIYRYKILYKTFNYLPSRTF